MFRGWRDKVRRKEEGRDLRGERINDWLRFFLWMEGYV